MATELQSFRLPGRGRFTLPIVGKKQENDLSGISKSTFEWTIVFSFLDAAFELFGFSHGTSRETIGHAVNQLFSGAATCLSDLVVIVPLDHNTPTFEQCMNNGTLCQSITIRRHGWVNGQIAVLEERTFNVCYITRFMQVLDYVVLTIRTCEAEEKVNVYTQAGEAKGVASSMVSTITGKSTSE